MQTQAQNIKAMQMAGCLKDTTSINKYIRMQKDKIYKLWDDRS